MLSDRSCGQCSANPEQRRLIGSGNNDDRATKPLGAENLKKFSHFASAFAHQRQHGHIRGCSPGHHADQRAFADAASAEDANALPSSASKERIDCADTAAQRLTNRNPLKRQRSRTIESN